MNYSKIGAYLKLTRERKGLSLHQVYEVTKIQVSILRDIEEGSAKIAPVVLKSFIKTYSRCLSLNFEKLEKEMVKQDLSELQDTDNNINNINKKGSAVLKTRYQYSIPILAFIIVFPLLFFLIFPNKFTQVSNENKIKNQADFLEIENKSLSKQTMISDSVKTAEEFFDSESFFEKIKDSIFKQDILIKSSAPLNIYFKADNSIAVNKTLNPFSWYYIKAKETLYLRFDDKPEGVQLFHNGEQLDLGSKDFFEKKFE